MTTEHLPKDISQLNSQLQAKFVHLNEVLDVVLKYSDLYKDRSPSKLLPFDNDKSSPEKSAKGDLSSFKGSPIKYNYESNNSNKHLSCEFSPGHSDMEAESPKLKVMRLLENIRPTDRSRISTPEKGIKDILFN